MREGACDYLQKPANRDEIEVRLEQIAERRELGAHVEALATAQPATEASATEALRGLEDQVVGSSQVTITVKAILLDTSTFADGKVAAVLGLLRKRVG